MTNQELIVWLQEAAGWIGEVAPSSGENGDDYEPHIAKMLQAIDEASLLIDRLGA